MNPLVVDIETYAPAWEGGLICVGLATPGTEPIIRLPGDPLIDFDNPTPIVSHTKYDPVYLKLAGYPVSGPYYDTQTMAWVLNENQPLDLDSLVQKYLGKRMDKRLKRSGGVLYFTDDLGTRHVLSDLVLSESPIMAQVYAYCARDVADTGLLFEALYEQLERTGWLGYYLEQEVPFTEVLVDMEVAGLPVNLDASNHLLVEMEPAIDTARAALHAEWGLPDNFNVNSNDQLAAFMYSAAFSFSDKVPITKEERTRIKEEDLTEWDGAGIARLGRDYVYVDRVVAGLDLAVPERTESGKPKVSTPTLLTAYPGHPFVTQLVAYRKMNKVVTTYLRVFPRKSHNGRLYGGFNQTGTKTGRLSSSGPNLQNIPAHGEWGQRVRSLFEGDLIIADYSQLEPRLMAHFSQDPVLLDIYREGRDLYCETASGVLGREVVKGDPERDWFKTYVLALGYGAGPGKLAQTLCLNGYPTTTGEAKEVLKELERLYAVFFRWKRHVIGEAKSHGYVTTLGGRHRRLRGQFASRNFKLIGYGERQAVNAVIQGSAGDIVRQTMVSTRHTLPHLPLVAQVHDELLWDHSRIQEQDDLVGAMVRIAELGEGYDLSVPLKFEPLLCSSWADKGTGLILPDDIEEDE